MKKGLTRLVNARPARLTCVKDKCIEAGEGRRSVDGIIGFIFAMVHRMPDVLIFCRNKKKISHQVGRVNRGF